MKKLLLLFCFLLSLNKTYSQSTEFTQEINAPVQSAIIYLYGAEVSHTKQVSLNPGRNKIIFTGLSPKLNAKSIQVSASGAVSILAISDAINYMANQKESTRIKQLKDSVTLLTDAITQHNNDAEAYNIEKGLLLKNQDIGGDKGVSTVELKLAADLFRSKIKEINAELFKLNKKTSVLNESLIKISQQLSELNAKNDQPTAEISILVTTASKTNSTIDLRYVVTDAGWSPNYDLHTEDINQPIELKYRAKVFNNTGVDWNDIKIKLSTSDPSKSAAKPQIKPWDLNTVTNYKKKKYDDGAYGYSEQNKPLSQSMDGYTQSNSAQNSYDLKAKQKEQAGKPKIEVVEIEISELSAEFDIKTNYTIPSDFKPYIVDVTEYKLPATYQHYSAPKLERDAFLLARITGWEDLDLVEGPANIYYSGTYVGQSYIYTKSTDDTLDLSLGRDNKVMVARTKIKDFNTKKIVGTTTKETFAYEIAIKNNRKTPVQIEVEDQLPISTQSDIIVDAIEISKAESDPKTGKLTWKYNLQPGEVKKITLSYSIKYPKNSKINIQKTQSHMNVRFL